MYLVGANSRKTALQERQLRCGQRVGFWRTGQGSGSVWTQVRAVTPSANAALRSGPHLPDERRFAQDLISQFPKPDLRSGSLQI